MSLHLAIQVLHAVHDLDNSEPSAPDDIEERIGMLAAVQEARKLLGTIEAAIEWETVKLIPGKVATVSGWQVEKKGGVERKQWDHDALRPRLAALARDERYLDESTGEIEGEAEAAIRVLHRVAKVDYYRLTELRALRLDPDEFCARERGRVHLLITPLPAPGEQEPTPSGVAPAPSGEAKSA